MPSSFEDVATDLLLARPLSQCPRPTAMSRSTKLIQHRGCNVVRGMSAGPRCAVVVAALSVAAAYAQDPTADEYMVRVGDYVQRFVNAFSNVVAEERYEPGPGHRERQRLLSDYSLVRSPTNQDDFLTFRDVLEVNGKPLRNQKERLTKLFLQPSGNPLEQARAVSAHSERYLPPTTDPLLAVVFLQRGYQARFRFALGERDPGLAPDVRRIAFVETQTPTLLGRADGSDLPTQGTAWVSETTGRVFKTELQFLGEERTLTTMFGTDDTLRIDVPIEMSESFSAAGVVVKGVARYSRFRRFGVHTNETIDTPEPGR